MYTMIVVYKFNIIVKNKITYIDHVMIYTLA